MDQRLMLLRIQLYAAMQMLTGEDADEFWKLIDEIVSLKEFHRTVRADAGSE